MKQKLNITIINRMMLTHFGGGENFDLNIAKQMRNRGHNIKIITGKSFVRRSSPPDDVYSFEIKTVPFVHIAHLSNKIGNKTKLTWFLSSFCINVDYLSFEISVFKKIKNDNWTDVYHICGLPRLASWIYKRLKKPVVVRWPGVPSRLARKYLDKYPVNVAGGDVFPKIRNWCNNAEYVEIGVDTEFFTPPKKKEFSEEIRFLFVGRLIKIKNIPFLLKGFEKVSKKYSNVSLHIVGDGEEREKLERLAGELGIREKVKFYGHIYKDELLKIYQNCHVFVITSEYENFPNVVLEAMACGLPVIATSVGGMVKQVKDGHTGFLVPLNKTYLLAEKMEFFLKNHQAILSFGKNAREFVLQNFSWKKTADKLEAIYRRLVK